MGINARADLAGRTFGDLVANEPTDARVGVSRSVVWHCKCVCGRVVLRPRHELIRGPAYACKHAEGKLRGSAYRGK